MKRSANRSSPVIKKSGPLVRYQVLSHDTETLVKQIERQHDGSILKRPGGQIPRGSTISTHEEPLKDYIQHAFNAGVSQYVLPANVELGAGVPISPKALVVDGGVDRTAATLQYVGGPATLTFDHDPSDYSTVKMTGPDALHSILAEEFPDVFKDAAWGGYTSSSSFIFAPSGEKIAGLKGFHIVFAVENATQIKEFGERLFKRLWLKGYGHIGISKDGSALVRTIFDKKPIEPQQPLFTGGAHCVGCEQRRPKPLWHDGSYLNLAALSPLSDAEVREYKRLVASATDAVSAEREAMRRQYTIDAIKNIVAEKRVSSEKAKRIVESRLGGVLVGSDVLMFDDHGLATVGDVLADPDKFDDCTLADPVDGGAAGKAILYFNKGHGVPLIFSQSHGGRTFFLKHDLQTLLARLQKMDKPQAYEEWASELPKAGLRADETEQYLIAVKDKTGLGITALRRAASDCIRLATQATSKSLLEDPGLYIANSLLRRTYNDGKTLIKLESGQFWYYTGTHWAPVKDSVLIGKLHAIAIEQWDHLLHMWKVSNKSPSTLAALTTSAMTSLGARVVTAGDPLRLNSTRPSVVNCLNGELWLTDEKAELRPHLPESYLTSCSEIQYDPAATAPTFEFAMRGMLSAPGGIPMADQDDMLRHLEELLGYSIQTRRNLKAFVVIVGPGDNGKTRITALLQEILGSNAIAFDRLSGVDEHSSRFAIARLLGKLVLIDDDIDHEYLLPDGLLKKIAEEKPLTGEAKFKDSFSFVAQVVPWLLGNSWPRSRDLTRGMQTRANVIYLPRSFLRPGECAEDHPDRQRPEIWEKIYGEEMAGVLNRLIAAYYRVTKRKGFLPPESAKKAFDMWLAEANVVARFIEDACDKTDGKKSECTTTTAYTAFIAWCDSNGVQIKHRPQQNTFGKRFEELGYRVKHNNTGSGIYGIKIRAEWIAQAQMKPFAVSRPPFDEDAPATRAA